MSIITDTFMIYVYNAHVFLIFLLLLLFPLAAVQFH